MSRATISSDVGADIAAEHTRTLGGGRRDHPRTRADVGLADLGAERAAAGLDAVGPERVHGGVGMRRMRDAEAGAAVRPDAPDRAPLDRAAERRGEREARLDWRSGLALDLEDCALDHLEEAI